MAKLSRLYWLIAVMLAGPAVPTVQAGTVSSGGGGGVLYEEESNPWFLANTATVSYCIDLDSEHVQQTQAQVDFLVRHAIDEWQTALAEATARYWLDKIYKPSFTVRIGTQTFTQQPCSPQTQLRFQIGKLTPEQQEWLPNPQHFVATAVRTAYDKVNLRGEGFIYVSPDSGPLRPTAANFAKNPWSVCAGCLLFRAFQHELGHVFGLSHSGGTSDIMGARTLEYLTEEDFVSGTMAHIPVTGDVDSTYPPVDVFAYPKEHRADRCYPQPDKLVNELFSIPADWKCFTLVMAPYSASTLRVYAAADATSELQLMGSTDNDYTAPSYLIGQNDITVKLNPEQQVFRPLPSGLNENTYLGGPTAYKFDEQMLTYKTKDGAHQTSLLLRLEPGTRSQIIGVGALVPNSPYPVVLFAD